MAQTAQPTQVMTSASLAGLSPAERQAYFQSLSPDQSQAAQADFASYVKRANAHYMALTQKKRAYCPPLGGGTTATFAAGASLVFDFPSAGGAFAEALEVVCNIGLTFAAGTGATYALNQLAPLTLFDRIMVTLNGQQHNFRPYILNYLGLLRGYGKSGEPTSVLAGNSDSNYQAIMNGTEAVTSGTNQWKFMFRIPLNPLNEVNPAGMLPMMSNGAKPQITIQCAPTLMGNDPILNAVRTTAGTGAAVTVGATATIQVNVIYRDGTNKWSPSALALDLSNVPTVQYIQDQTLTQFVAGVINRQRITTLLQHYLVLSAVVDGVTAGSLAATSNLGYFELAMDSVGQNTFYRFGTGTNIAVYDYFEDLRRQFGQDLPEGIIPWVVGWGENTSNTDNREGVAALNMMEGGWTDVHIGINPTSTGANSNGPRVETHLVALNPAGLKLVQI